MYYHSPSSHGGMVANGYITQDNCPCANQYVIPYFWNLGFPVSPADYDMGLNFTALSNHTIFMEHNSKSAMRERAVLPNGTAWRDYTTKNNADENLTGSRDKRDMFSIAGRHKTVNTHPYRRFHDRKVTATFQNEKVLRFKNILPEYLI